MYICIKLYRYIGIGLCVYLYSGSVFYSPFPCWMARPLAKAAQCPWCLG